MSESQKHFAVVVGARPNFVKAAPLFLRIKQHPDIRLTLIHTGQHYDDSLSKIFFDEMGIPKPDIQLTIEGETSSEKMGHMLSSLYKVLQEAPYDGVIVFGDIDSSFAASIAALRAGRTLFHVEAGLRSHDKRMPEERNRIVIDHAADVLFTTEPIATENLLKEGIPKEMIIPVGNIMIESLELFKEVIDASAVLEDLSLLPKKYVVVTIHRVENTDNEEIFTKILMALEELSRTHTLVMPLHPGTRAKIEAGGHMHFLKDVKVIEPLGYIEFVKLVKESAGVVTDSGGIQEETTHLGIPCATLRDSTERPITVTEGTNKLFPLASLKASEVSEYLTHTNFTPRHIALWDGEVSERIITFLKK